LFSVTSFVVEDVGMISSAGLGIVIAGRTTEPKASFTGSDLISGVFTDDLHSAGDIGCSIFCNLEDLSFVMESTVSSISFLFFLAEKHLEHILNVVGFP